MKKIILIAFAALSISASAHADVAHRYHVLACSDASGIMDAGYTVLIDRVYIPAATPTAPVFAYFEAILRRITIAGAQEIGRFTVLDQSLPGARNFSNESFSLSLPTIPPTSGGYRAEMVAEVEGRRISAILSCRYVR